MRPFRFLSLTLSAAFTLGIGMAAHADTVITFSGTTTVGEGATAPGSASNYDFFGVGQSHLTNFTVTPLDNSFPGNGGYSTITAPGGSSAFRTGTEYNSGNPANVILATFTATFNGSFTVYILNGNTDLPFVEDTEIGLGVSGGSEVSSPSLQADTTNQFNIYTVTGVTAGEVFDIYAMGGNGVPGDESNVGGITFNASPVPEPSSLVLLGAGVLGAFGATRRRFKA